jgi:hypothetical protein
MLAPLCRGWLLGVSLWPLLECRWEVFETLLSPRALSVPRLAALSTRAAITPPRHHWALQ